jgi:hypothetical protein
MILADKTSHQIQIPQNDLFELHALFSRSLAWIETGRRMIEQQARPSRINLFFL